jgi:hypothetical protein
VQPPNDQEDDCDNRARARQGLPALRCNDAAGSIAYKWAKGQCKCDLSRLHLLASSSLELLDKNFLYLCTLKGLLDACLREASTVGGSCGLHCYSTSPQRTIAHIQRSRDHVFCTFLAFRCNVQSTFLTCTLCLQRKQDEPRWLQKPLAHGFRACGENVAYNLPPRLDETVDDTHRRWMNSPGHRANIMSKGFDVVGYGFNVCPKRPGGWAYKVYWTGWFMG